MGRLDQLQRQGGGLGLKGRSQGDKARGPARWRGEASASRAGFPPKPYAACLPAPPAQVKETEEEQQARLERFAAELEAGGAAGAEPAEQ